MSHFSAVLPSAIRPTGGMTSVHAGLRVALVLAGAALFPPAFAADWYVDGAKGRNDQSGQRDAPFQTVWRAWRQAEPGDVIHVLPTTLYNPIYLAGKSGEPGKPITIRGTGSISNPTRVSGMGYHFGVMLDTDTNYIRLENFDITAPGAGRHSAWSGVYIKNSHHVTVANNRVHDAGCSGIQTHGADYVTVVRNTVYGNAKDTTNYVYCSGISLYQSRDVDASTGVKMVVAQNIIFGNTNVPMPDCGTRCHTADGNGIIIDDSRRTKADRQAYQGSHLVENNVIFGNGAKGVHVYQSDNVTIRSNTIYNNNLDPFHGYRNAGEINVNNAAGIDIYSNVVFSRGLKPHPAISVQHGRTPGKPVNVDHNLTFNADNDASTAIFAGSNPAVMVRIGRGNRFGDPQFLQASLDPALADFRVAASSPARDFSAQDNSFAIRDILHTHRYALDRGPSWAPLAREGGSFSVSGVQTVRYGKGNRWIEKRMAGAGRCTTTFFGNDPLHGAVKECQLLIQSPVKTATGTWARIAGDKSDFSIAGTQTVRYGSGADWAVRRLSTRVQCSSAAFGKSLAAGTTAQCDLLVAPPPPKPAGAWSSIAGEGADFSVIGSQTVRYGSGSRWIEKSVNDLGKCDNAFFGKDPYLGVGKRCELFSPASPMPPYFNLHVQSGRQAPVITAGAYQLPF